MVLQIFGTYELLLRRLQKTYWTWKY